MELTQRLEWTQELFTKKCEKINPEQVGFLGICGTKYPLKKGPNKIGRDPETCSIVLNLNSISRQHAVINILNSQEYMLMDLDSSNKTKISDKVLPPYIPHPLTNGDMVQFGQVFGIFRLLEEENDLPMTQAIDIPETPLPLKHVSKPINIPATIIPESPDVSDRDDSIIGISQPKPKNSIKSQSNNFIKPSEKIIAVKQVGTNKIDNIYWSSSKKSDSFSTQCNISSIQDNSVISLPMSDSKIIKKNIHELDTQISYKNNDESTESIYNANTQVPEDPPSPNIYNLETQIPVQENLSQVYKMQSKQNTNFDLCTEDKENRKNIFNAETQICELKDILSTSKGNIDNVQARLNSSRESNISDDIILFDEIDDKPLPENFDSQPLLSEELMTLNRQLISGENENQSENCKKTLVRTNRFKSDSSTDCEDNNNALTSKIPTKVPHNEKAIECIMEYSSNEVNKKLRKSLYIDEDSTDCEDNLNEKDTYQLNNLEDNINFEDLPTQIIYESNFKKANALSNKNNGNIIDDPPTQILERRKSDSTEHLKQNTNFEDLCTQVLDIEPQNLTEKQRLCFDEELTEANSSAKEVSFKVPEISILKKKNKTSNEVLNQDRNNAKKEICAKSVENTDEKYYAATQELFNDLCSQQIQETKGDNSTKVQKYHKTISNSKFFDKDDNNVINQFRQESPESNDIEAKINEFVFNLSCSQIQDVVGVKKEVSNVKKASSASSDNEVTPKKINCLLLLNTDLPNSQEIRKDISLISKDSDKESDKLDHDSEEDSTINLTEKRMNKLNKIKINLNKKFNPETLPTRSSTRVRKPTSMLKKFKEINKIVNGNKVKTKSFKAQENKMDKFVLKEKKICIKQHPNIINSEKCNYSENKNDVIQENATSNENKEIEKKNSHKSLNVEHNNDIRLKNEIPTQSNTKIIDTKNTNSNRNYVNSSRSTRSRSKQKAESVSKKSKSPKKDESKIEVNKNSKLKTDVRKHDSQPETEVRRSTRNRNTRKLEEISHSISKSKMNHEQSTVYGIANLSSDSSVDSPNKLKRPAMCDPNLPVAKKSRTEIFNNTNNCTSRVTPARKIKTHYVLFTAFPCEEVKFKIQKLGATVVSDVMQCTVVLTVQIKRTFKLLCAMGLGKPIVGPNWVQACVDTNMIVDPWLYLIKDEATEKRFQFSLQRTLVGKKDFLKGYNVSSTPGVMPSAPEMKMIVECSGGKWKGEGPNWICVSASVDKHLWPGLKKKGAILVSTEFILGGVLRQKLEIDKCKLT